MILCGRVSGVFIKDLLFGLQILIYFVTRAGEEGRRLMEKTLFFVVN